MASYSPPLLQPMLVVEQSPRANHIEAFTQSLRDTCARTGIPFNWSLDYINSLVHHGRVRAFIVNLQDNAVNHAVANHTQLAPNEINKMIEIQAVAWFLGLQVQRIFTVSSVINNRAQPRRLFRMPTAETRPENYISVDVWICVEIDQATYGERITWYSFCQPASIFDIVDNATELALPFIIDDNATGQLSANVSQNAPPEAPISFHSAAPPAAGRSLGNIFFTNPATADDVMEWSGRPPLSVLPAVPVTSPLGLTRDLVNEDGTYNPIISDSDEEPAPIIAPAALANRFPSTVSTSDAPGFRPIPGASGAETRPASPGAESTDIDAEGETDDEMPVAAAVSAGVPGDSSSLSSVDSGDDEQDDEHGEAHGEGPGEAHGEAHGEDHGEEQASGAEEANSSEAEDVNMSDFEVGAPLAQGPAQVPAPAPAAEGSSSAAAQFSSAAVTEVAEAPAAVLPILTTTEAEVHDILTEWDHVTPKGHDLLRCLTWFNNSSLSRELDVVPSNVAHARKKALQAEGEATGVLLKTISDAIDEQRIINTGRK